MLTGSHGVNAGPLNITVLEGRVPRGSPRSGGLFCTRRPQNWASNTHQYRRDRDVHRCEHSSGAVRSLKATALIVALRLLTPPGERHRQPVKIQMLRY